MKWLIWVVEHNGVKMRTNNFCSLPWTQIEIQTDGTYRACCRQVGKQYHNKNEDVLKFPEAGFKEAWESDSLKELRQKFLNNERPEECANCWKEEAAGIESLRLNMSKPLEDIDTTNPVPKLLDLKLGSHCNIKCRICNPFISSQWTTEAHRETSKQWAYFDKKFVQHKRNDSVITANKEILDDWLPQVEQICVYGGETFMIPPFFELLDMCVDSGHAEHIELIFNTNGTYFKPEVAEKLNHFKMVLFHWSIDDLGERFNYQRHPSNFDKVIENVKLWNNIIDRNIVKNKIWCTVSLMNIAYLPELAQYWNDNLKQYIELLDFGYCHEPFYYNMKVLPKHTKKWISKKLLSSNPIDIGDWKYATDKSCRTSIDHFEKMINFMNSEDLHAEHWEDFKEESLRADLYRKENFAQTFPELNNNL